MNLTIKTSEANHQIVRDLTSKFDATYENVVAQFAIAYSIAQNRHFKIEDAKDSKGKEYKDSQLGGSRFYLFIALISQHYDLYKTDTQIPKLLKIHLDDGLELMKKFFEDNPSFTGFDFLLDQIEKGLYTVDEDLSFIFNSFGDIGGNKYVKPYCIQPIRIKVGKEVDTEHEVFLTLNDTSKYNNSHIAVAGRSGTGKTHLALNLLTRITQESNQIVNFIYLDFKGLEGSLSDSQNTFFEQTNCDLIQIPLKPFPVNPLSAIDLVNDSNQRLGIRKFVDTISNYGKLGTNQYQALISATRDCFATKKNSPPTLKDIQNQLSKTYSKADTLTQLMDLLTEQELFADNADGTNFLEKNTYVSLSQTLGSSIRTISVFMIIDYLYLTFMKMPDTPDQNGMKGIRYVILIDEAHVLFKERKAQQLLDQILRMIRSRGVSIMLLSQGISEFNQPDFDFSSNCEIAFLMDVNDKTNLKAVQKFLGFNDKEKNVISRSLNNLQRYQALTNLKEVETGRLVQLL
jgi:DNA sulfur modification protein DndE